MRYAVLMNHEEQFALYPEDLAVPDGWSPAGFAGDEDACVGYVDRHWTDMRPLSLRRALDDADRDGVAASAAATRAAG